MTDVDLNEDIYKDMFGAMQKLKRASSNSREQCIEKLDSFLKETFKEEIPKSVLSSFTETTTSKNDETEEKSKTKENLNYLNATETVTDSHTKLSVETPGMLTTLYASQPPLSINTNHHKKGEFSSYVNFDEFVDVPENEKKWGYYNQLNEQAILDAVNETNIEDNLSPSLTNNKSEKIASDFLKKEKVCGLSTPPPELDEIEFASRNIDDFPSEACSSVTSSIQWDCCELPERLLLDLKESKILSKKNLQILTTYCWSSYYAHKELSARNARALYLKRLRALCQKGD